MISTIKKTYLRKELLEAAIAKLQFMIDDCADRLKLLVESDGHSGDAASYDGADSPGSRPGETTISGLNAELDSANDDFKLLENLKMTQDIDRAKVSLGAIVFTNHQTFFVSAGIEKIVVDGQAFVCISTRSPIYQEMVGLRSGETFRYHSTHYRIREIL